MERLNRLPHSAQGMFNAPQAHDSLPASSEFRASGRYNRKVPVPRKAWIIFVSASTLINLILVVVALVRPTPNFSTSVLFIMRSVEAASLTRRDVRQWDMAGMPLILSDHISLRDAEQHDLPVDDEVVPTRCTTASVSSDTSTRYIIKTVTRFVPKSASAITKTSSSPTVPSQSPTQTAARGGPLLLQALYIGPMGACLEQKRTFRSCSGISFKPTFKQTYDRSTLPTDVIAALPTGTKGATVLLFLAVLAFGVAALCFVFAYPSTTTARTEEGHRAYTSLRHVTLLGIATLGNSIGVILVIVCLLIFKSLFQQALDQIPRLPYELFPVTGGATGPLYVSCASGGLSTLVGIYLLVSELKLVILENSSARSRKERQDKVAAKEPTFRTKRRSPTLPTPPTSPTVVEPMESMRSPHGSFELGNRTAREGSRGFAPRSLPFDLSLSSRYAGGSGAPPRRNARIPSSFGSDSPLDAFSDINSPAGSVASAAAGRPFADTFDPATAPGSFIDFLRSQTNAQASSRYSSSSPPDAGVLRSTRGDLAHREEPRQSSFRRMFAPNL